MIARGHVENGVVVLDDGVRLPEGELVTVFASPPVDAGEHGHRSSRQSPESAPISKDRQEALLQLIGIWKTAQPPNDEEVERILEQERMKQAWAILEQLWQESTFDSGGDRLRRNERHERR